MNDFLIVILVGCFIFGDMFCLLIDIVCEMLFCWLRVSVGCVGVCGSGFLYIFWVVD